MHIHTKFKGHLSDLISRHHNYRLFNNVSVIESSERRWSRSKGSDWSFDLQVIIIGKTGYGKSTTLNALLGKKLVETSHNQSCTRDMQSFEFMINHRSYLSIADFPGIGESEARDVEYFKVYKKMESRSDAIVYILRADARDYSKDLILLSDLLTASDTKNKIIIALNFCDKIEPLSRDNKFCPSGVQLNNIALKIYEIQNLFKPVNKIIPYCAESEWNLDVLHESVVSTLLRSKYLTCNSDKLK